MTLYSYVIQLMTPNSSARTAVNLTKGDRSQTQISCCKIPRAHQLLTILAEEKESKTNNLTQFSRMVWLEWSEGSNNWLFKNSEFHCSHKNRMQWLKEQIQQSTRFSVLCQNLFFFFLKKRAFWLITVPAVNSFLRYVEHHEFWLVQFINLST